MLTYRTMRVYLFGPVPRDAYFSCLFFVFSGVAAYYRVSFSPPKSTVFRLFLFVCNCLLPKNRNHRLTSDERTVGASGGWTLRSSPWATPASPSATPSTNSTSGTSRATRASCSCAPSRCAASDTSGSSPTSTGTFERF